MGSLKRINPCLPSQQTRSRERSAPLSCSVRVPLRQAGADVENSAHKNARVRENLHIPGTAACR
jgi:hypothetical protein